MNYTLWSWWPLEAVWNLKCKKDSTVKNFNSLLYDVICENKTDCLNPAYTVADCLRPWFVLGIFGPIQVKIRVTRTGYLSNQNKSSVDWKSLKWFFWISIGVWAALWDNYSQGSHKNLITDGKPSWMRPRSPDQSWRIGFFI